jgi:hypothetical protein
MNYKTLLKPHYIFWILWKQLYLGSSSANFYFISWTPSSLSWAKTILSYRLDSVEIAFRFSCSTISNQSFLKCSHKVSLYDSTVKQLQWTLRLRPYAKTLAFLGW